MLHNMTLKTNKVHFINMKRQTKKERKNLLSSEWKTLHTTKMINEQTLKYRKEMKKL
jgi:hypothetical protein